MIVFSAIAKLAAVTCAVLGPFIAGTVSPFALDPEVYAFCVMSGIALGLAGLFAFAAIEREEGVRHARNLRREG
jgi:uncharacterized membrane protein